MASDKKLLLNSLKDLRKEDLKEFQWHLENDHECILKSDMENADILDTVDLMTKRFGPEEAVKITVGILKEMNQNNLAKELENKHKQAQAKGRMEDPALVGASSKPMEALVPRTRNYFLQYSHQFTLDPNTVNNRLHLSERNRVITNTFPKIQPYPDHPARFDYYYQVLCRESVSECCYWEIEPSGYVFVSVSYKNISRKGSGKECMFGYNDQSWSLICSSSSYSFRHNNMVTVLPVKPTSDRIGVYVDPSAGTLSFYSVSDTMSIIHTVQTTFTHSLYPGFRVGYGWFSAFSGASVKLC